MTLHVQFFPSRVCVWVNIIFIFNNTRRPRNVFSNDDTINKQNFKWIVKKKMRGGAAWHNRIHTHTHTNEILSCQFWIIFFSCKTGINFFKKCVFFFLFSCASVCNNTLNCRCVIQKKKRERRRILCTGIRCANSPLKEFFKFPSQNISFFLPQFYVISFKISVVVVVGYKWDVWRILATYCTLNNIFFFCFVLFWIRHHGKLIFFFKLNMVTGHRGE